MLSKIMEQIHLETKLRHMENKEVTNDNQYGFIKGKSCLTFGSFLWWDYSINGYGKSK